MRSFVLRLATPLLALLLSACAPLAPTPLTLATTTSVGNSGLLDILLPAFEREHGTGVQAHLVGSSRALEMLAGGGADVVVSHAPQAERAALDAHPRWTYGKLMFNDFVIAGPSDDPAGAGGARSVDDAMRRIASSTARFISRGDRSGTHECETQLWARAGGPPATDRLVTAGSGMGSTLRVASGAGAYTLTDRGTFAQLAGSLRLDILFEGDPILLNTYAVLFDPAGPRSAEARAFAGWLVTGEGRRLIAAYRTHAGTIAFEPWPEGRAASRPEDLPR